MITQKTLNDMLEKAWDKGAMAAFRNVYEGASDDFWSLNPYAKEPDASPSNPDQHCTSKTCPYDFSHTAKWCGYAQKRRCDCGFCYGEDDNR